MSDADELEVGRLRMPERMVVGRIDTAENAVIDAMYRPVRVRLEGPDRWKGPMRAVSEQSRRGPDGADGHCHQAIGGASGGGGRVV